MKFIAKKRVKSITRWGKEQGIVYLNKKHIGKEVMIYKIKISN